MGPARRAARVVVVGLALGSAGCGEPPPVAAPPASLDHPATTVPAPAVTGPTTTHGALPTSEPTLRSPDEASDGAGWALTRWPPGFQPVLVTDRAGRREVYYQRVDSLGDLYDSPIVVVAAPDVFSVDWYPTAQPMAGSRSGFVYELRGDGEHYGTGVAVEDGTGGWVVLEWAELVPESEVVELAEHLAPVDPVEWDRMRRALAIDTRIGQVGDEFTEVIAIEGSVDAVPYRLVVLVPDDYPLGADDLRRACSRLDVAGALGEPRCDDHPWWTRTAGHAFVVGPAGPDVTGVAVHRRSRDGEPVDEPPVAAATATVDGPPGSWYAVAIPEDWCWVEIGADGVADDPRLGPIGPLPADPNHVDCLAAG